MDSIFFEHPALLLFAAGGLLLHALTYFTRKTAFSQYVAVANIALHSAAVCIMYGMGASNEDMLLFVLFAAFSALLQCRIPRNDNTKGGRDK